MQGFALKPSMNFGIEDDELCIEMQGLMAKKGFHMVISAQF